MSNDKREPEAPEVTDKMLAYVKEKFDIPVSIPNIASLAMSSHEDIVSITLFTQGLKHVVNHFEDLYARQVESGGAV